MSSSCSICLEYLQGQEDSPIIALPCGHMYHEQCIEMWFRKQPGRKPNDPLNVGFCPYCNQLTLFCPCSGIKLIPTGDDQVADLQSTVNELKEKEKFRLETNDALKVENEALKKQLDDAIQSKLAAEKCHQAAIQGKADHIARLQKFLDFMQVVTTLVTTVKGSDAVRLCRDLDAFIQKHSGKRESGGASSSSNEAAIASTSGSATSEMAKIPTASKSSKSSSTVLETRRPASKRVNVECAGQLKKSRVGKSCSTLQTEAKGKRAEK